MDMNKNYVPDCGTDNCNCKDCMFYAGTSHGAVRCLAEEELSKAAARPKKRGRKDKKENGSEN